MLHHLGLSSTKFDTFMKEAIIESANNKENIDIEKLVNELMQHKKAENHNLNENLLKRNFTEEMVNVREEWSKKVKLDEAEKTKLSEGVKGKNMEHKKSHLLSFQ